MKVAIDSLGREQASLHKARSSAVKQRDQLDEKRKEITRATEEQQSLLAQAQGKIKSLVDEIAAEKAAPRPPPAAALEHQQALTQARAVQQAQLQQAQPSSDNSGSSSSGSSSGSNSSSGFNPNVAAAGPQAQVAVDYAKAELGQAVPCSAAAGPDTFDCSGLDDHGVVGRRGDVALCRSQFQSLPPCRWTASSPATSCSSGSPSTTSGCTSVAAR